MGLCGSQQCAQLCLSHAWPGAAGGAGLCQCCSRCSRPRLASLSWPVNIYDPFTRFFLPSCERFAAFSCWKERELLLGAVARKTKGAFLELSSTRVQPLALVALFSHCSCPPAAMCAVLLAAKSTARQWGPAAICSPWPQHWGWFGGAALHRSRSPCPAPSTRRLIVP